MQPINYTFDKRRFETFFDGIVAIILTILVLELKLPETEHTENLSTQQQLVCLIPMFVSYFGSFLLIVGIWLDHHVLFLNLQKLTKPYVLLNMLFIFSLSVVPFTTAFAGNHYHDSFAVALLFVNYFVMNFLFGMLYAYGWKNKLINREFLDDNKGTAIYSFVGVAGLALAIPLAYFNTYLSFALGIAIFLGHLMKKK